MEHEDVLMYSEAKDFVRSSNSTHLVSDRFAARCFLKTCLKFCIAETSLVTFLGAEESSTNYAGDSITVHATVYQGY